MTLSPESPGALLLAVVDELESFNLAYNEFGSPAYDRLDSAIERVTAIASSLEGQSEDAARYRWLRERAAKLAVYSDVAADVLIAGEWQDKPGALDTAIDEARAAQQESES